MDEKTGSQGGLALLIGINTYPHFETRRQLGGCLNDVQIMKDALMRRFGFQEDRITVLRNMEATRAAILAAFEDLVHRADKNDNIVVHFSGHGSQKPDKEGDEPDGWDETLVPCDSGRAPYTNRDITDDEIHEWLKRLMSRTHYVTLIIDCCNSGTILREGRVRGLPREEREASERASPARSGPVFRDAWVGTKSFLREGEQCVLFAACRSNEFANEILVGDPPLVPHGALTYYLVQELMSPEFQGATYTEVFERLRPKLTGKCEAQHPQLEGERNRLVLGQETIVPMPFVSVLCRQGDQLTLEAGAVSGISPGSRWIVYAPGTREVTDNAVCLGTVSIVAVGVTTSEAKVMEENPAGAVIPGARAVEGFARLSVDLVTPPEHPKAELMAVALGRSKLLAWSYPGGHADARVLLLSPGSPASDLVRQVGALSEDVWVVVDEKSLLMGPPVSLRDADAPRTVVANLESMARLSAVAGATNPGSPLAKLVEFNICRWTGNDGVPPIKDEKGEMVFYEGDRLVLEMYNHSPRPLYAYVLDIGLTGRVAIVYPLAGSGELLESDQKIQVGIRSSEDLTLSLPPGFERLPEAFQCAARETLKLIVSTGPAEFRLLLQSGQRYRGRGPAGSLEDALVASFGSGSPLGSGEDWTTVEKTFRLLPKAAPLT
jgi:hypothetical protein